MNHTHTEPNTHTHTHLDTHTHTHTHRQRVPGPHEKYNCEEASKVQRLTPIQPSNTSPSRDVQFLRDVPLKGVVRYLKDHLLSPTKVLGENMTNHREFTNFPQVLHTGHAVYCALEGNNLAEHDSNSSLQTISNLRYIRFSFAAIHDFNSSLHTFFIRHYTRFQFVATYAFIRHYT